VKSIVCIVQSTLWMVSRPSTCLFELSCAHCDDVLGIGAPNEWSWVLIVLSGEAVDSGLKFSHQAKECDRVGHDAARPCAGSALRPAGHALHAISGFSKNL
jgi:hypothetical protein